MPCLHAATLNEQGQAQLLEADAAKAMHGRWASGLLLILVIVLLTTIVLHVLVILLWRAYPGTAKRPLPAFLTFPVPEVMVANGLLLPLAVTATVLLMQGGNSSRQGTGAGAAIVLLGYLGWLLAVMLPVRRHQEALRLKYVKLRKQSPAPEGAQQPAGAAAASMLQRLAPRHASGYWCVRDLAVQQQLRYSGKSP
jgi:hypothetical protein